jgi:hypothetical protein
MQRLEVSGAVRPLKWPVGAKWLNKLSPGAPQIQVRDAKCPGFFQVIKINFW